MPGIFLFGLLIIGLPALLLIIILNRIGSLRRDLDSQQVEIKSLNHRLSKLEGVPLRHSSESSAPIPVQNPVEPVRPAPAPQPVTPLLPIQPRALHTVPLSGPRVPQSSPIAAPARSAHTAPTEASVEKSIASRIFVWLGGIAFMFAGFFLIKYSIEQGLFTPGLRVIAAGVFAALLLGGAEIFHRRKEGDFIASILAGASMAVAYCDAYAASGFYGLIPIATGFALAVLVTALTVAFSFRYGEKLSVLAVAGGFFAPALFHTGSGSTVLLFSYLIVLTFGLLGVFARRRQINLSIGVLFLNFLWVALWHLTGMYSAENVLFVLIFLALLNPAYLLFTYRVRDFLKASGRICQLRLLTLIPLLCSLVFAGGHTLTAPATTVAFIYLLSGIYVLFAYCLRDFLETLKTTRLFAVLTILPLFSALGVSVLHSVRAGTSAGYFVGALAFFAALYAFGLRQRKVFHPLYWVPYVALLLTLLTLRYAMPAYGWLAILVGLPALLTLLLLWRTPADTSRLVLFELLTLSGAGYVCAAQIHMGSLYYSTPALLALPLLGALHWALYPRLCKRAGEGARKTLSAVFLCGFALPFAYAILVHPAVLRPALFGLLAAVCAYFARRWNVRAAGLASAVATAAIFWCVRPVAFAFKNILFATFENRPGWDFCLSWGVACGALFAAWHWLKGHSFEDLRTPYGLAPAISLVGLAALLSNALVTTFAPVPPWYAWISAAPLVVMVVGALLARWGERTDTYGFFVTGVITLIAAAVRYTLIESDFSPVIHPLEVSGVLFLNGFTCSLALPSLIFAWTARGARNRALKIGAGVAALVGFYLFGATQVRMLAQGPLMCNPYQMGEFYAYSMYTLAYGILLLALGYLRKDKVLRGASLVFVLAAVAKVFLLDASQLEGLWRVLSFALLGACLIGIGYFYARVVFKADKAQDNPTAAPSA